jgi:glycine cleavage system H protein
MSEVPDNLRYAKTHEWARRDADGTVRVGISDHAQEALGDVVYLELPEVGRRIRAGEACAVVESVKAASDIYSPVSGEIVDCNADLIEKPELINQKPYAAWLFAVKPEAPAEWEQLLDAEDYRRVSESGD